jgi:hypothetical protein
VDGTGYPAKRGRSEPSCLGRKPQIFLANSVCQVRGNREGKDLQSEETRHRTREDRERKARRLDGATQEMDREDGEREQEQRWRTKILGAGGASAFSCSFEAILCYRAPLVPVRPSAGGSILWKLLQRKTITAWIIIAIS